MLRLFSFTLFVLFLSTFVIASPLDRFLGNSLDTRQSTCVADIRKQKLTSAITGRDITSLEVDEDETLLEQRAFVKGALCNVIGGFDKPCTPAASSENMSFQACANWCKCDLSRAECQTFQWHEYAGLPGLGACSIYTRGLKYEGFVTGAGTEGPFYERGCFKKGTATTPPPYQTTKPPSYPTEAPKAKREDTTEKFWALVLAEA